MGAASPAITRGSIAMLRRIAVMVLGILLGAVVEHTVVGLRSPDGFGDGWTGAVERASGVLLFLAVATPLAAAFAWIFAMAERKARTLLALTCGAGASAVGLGITTGPHFASLAARVPFVALFAMVGAVVGAQLLPWVVRWKGNALLFAAAAVGAWSADLLVLPRAYPAFHGALFVLALGACAFAAASATWRLRWAPAVGGGLGVLSLMSSPFAMASLRGDESLRRAFVEHDPWLGRATFISTLLMPPLRVESMDDSLTDLAVPGEVARSLDWTGRDILLITVDALRADHMGAYGYRRNTTPHFDALAIEGALFEHAYCAIPHTSYSLTSLMTGKYIRPLLELGLGEDSDTWAAHLQRYGYRTAAFYPPAVFSVDTERFAVFRDRGFDFEYRREEFADARFRAEQVRSYLAEAGRDEPIFLWVHFFEPHEPYEQHAGHWFGDSDLDAYDSEIAATDAEIGRVVRAMRETHPDTVIVIAADHGEEFDDHGGRHHGTTAYEEQVRVPLLVLGPGVAARRVVAPVQTIDLLPTVLSALGGARPPRLRGRDLGLFLAGLSPQGERGLAFAEADDYQMLADGPLRLVCERRSAGCSLYDVSVDPLEQKNRGDERKSELVRLRGLLDALRRQHSIADTAAP